MQGSDQLDIADVQHFSHIESFGDFRCALEEYLPKVAQIGTREQFWTFGDERTRLDQRLAITA